MNNWSNSWNDAPKPVVEQLKNPTPSPFPEWDAKSRDEVLAEWEQRQQLLAKAKAREMDFRKYVVSRAFPNAEEGTNTVELNNGYKLKAVIKYNYKLSENKIVEDGLDKIAAIGNQGQFIADRIVGWTPNFYVLEYRELQKQADEGSNEAKEMLKIVNNFMTITEAAPTVNIVEPKVKK